MAFANILLYDTGLNVLIYEINRNGCYLLFRHLGKTKEWIERRWNENQEGQEIEIHFPTQISRNEYNRVRGMTNYWKLIRKLLNPAQIIHKMNNHRNSFAELIIRHQAENGHMTGADFVTIDQNCSKHRHKFHMFFSELSSLSTTSLFWDFLNLV